MLTYQIIMCRNMLELKCLGQHGASLLYYLIQSRLMLAEKEAPLLGLHGGSAAGCQHQHA